MNSDRMNTVIKLTSNEDEEQVSAFLLTNETSLLYHSVRYKKLLEKYLKCKSYYYIALNSEDEIVGYLPLMIHFNAIYGNIANSLPFYGSNGSVVLKKNIDDELKQIVTNELFNTALQTIEQNNCVATTFITNPLDSYANDWMKVNFNADFLDSRIGQITHLPENTVIAEDELLKMFDDPRPRNIRKAMKSGVTCYRSNSLEDMQFLYQVHYDNISAINGVPKEESFFKLIPDCFDENDYKIYIAEKDGKKIAALLLFYFNKTVEYYTPAVVEEYRNLQPSSLLIFQAMKDAINMGYKNWNWGGTWLTQSGVYDFKKKWAAVDYPYYYHTKIYNKEILSLSKKILLNNYPNFFVVSFNQLKK